MNKILSTTIQNDSSLNRFSGDSGFSKKTVLVLAIAAALTLSGCATNGETGTRNGALLGGLIGAVTGAVTGNSERAVFGAVTGALVGGAVGNYQDRQQRDLEEQLAAEVEAEMIQIQRLEDETLQVSLSNEASFDVDSSALKPAFLPALDRLGALLQKYDKTAVHVIGHTDSTGEEDYNMELSRDRAGAVARYTGNRGLDQRRIKIEGRGENVVRGPKTIQTL